MKNNCEYRSEVIGSLQTQQAAARNNLEKVEQSVEEVYYLQIPTATAPDQLVQSLAAILHGSDPKLHWGHLLRPLLYY